MVISILNYEKIEKRLSLIEESLLNLIEIKNFGKEEFFNNKYLFYSAESNLRRSLEAIFDIGRHILSKIYGFKDFEYKQIAKLLVEKNIIPYEFLSSLVKMAGYRNRLVHFYIEITREEMWNIIENHLNDIDLFVKYINEFIEKIKKSRAKQA